MKYLFNGDFQSVLGYGIEADADKLNDS